MVVLNRHYNFFVCRVMNVNLKAVLFLSQVKTDYLLIAALECL